MAQHLIEDPQSAFRLALAGNFGGYSTALSDQQLVESIASVSFYMHEQRHYDDYFVTNYGNWLANFWSSVRQMVDGSISNPEVPVPVPLWFWHDPLGQRILGAFETSERTEQLARYCWNHRRLLELDTDDNQILSIAGSAQLECLATAYETAPIDAVDNARLGRQVREYLLDIRNAELFSRRYSWMAHVLEYVGVGPRPQGNVAYSRLWPPFLVASLMGEFSRLVSTPAHELSMSLYENVLPSHRLAAIMVWCESRRLDHLVDPLEAWDILNSACKELFGATVLESMEADISFSLNLCAPVLHQLRSDPSTPIHSGLRDAIGRIFTRQQYLEVLRSDPGRLIDPGLANHQVLARPDHILYRLDGFESVIDGYEELRSPPFARKEGDVLFLRPMARDADTAALLDDDEMRSVLERYLVNGATGREWIGPELAWMRDNLPDHYRVHAPYR